MSGMDLNFFFPANQFLLFNTNTKEEKLLCIFFTQIYTNRVYVTNF